MCRYAQWARHVRGTCGDLPPLLWRRQVPRTTMTYIHSYIPRTRARTTDHALLFRLSSLWVWGLRVSRVLSCFHFGSEPDPRTGIGAPRLGSIPLSRPCVIHAAMKLTVKTLKGTNFEIKVQPTDTVSFLPRPRPVPPSGFPRLPERGFCLFPLISAGKCELREDWGRS